MTYTERFRSFSAAQIATEREGVAKAFKILHELGVSNSDYMILNLLLNSIPREYPMPYNMNEIDEYNALRKLSVGFGSEGEHKRSDK